MFVRVKRKIATKKHKKRKFIFWCLLCLFAANVFKMKEDLRESCK